LYNNGKNDIGHVIIGKNKLIEIIRDNNKKILSPNKFVDEFIGDLENMNILKLNGKRRIINMSYTEALKTVEEYDESVRNLDEI
jgi:hypothetical protein